MGWGRPLGAGTDRTLTWHVDHAAVAAAHHGLLLALQAAGGDAVGVVAGQGLLPLHAGPAVAPGLRQVGELPGREGIAAGTHGAGTSPGLWGITTARQRLGPRGAKRHPWERHHPAVPTAWPHMASALSWPYPLLLAGHEGLEARRDAEAQLMDVGRLVLAVDLDSDASFEGCLVWGGWKGSWAAGPMGQPSAPVPRALPAAPLTGLPPDGQVFLLLDVQHDLQPVAHAALAGDPRVPPVPVEGVAFAVARIDLGMERGRVRDGEGLRQGALQAG